MKKVPFITVLLTLYAVPILAGYWLYILPKVKVIAEKKTEITVISERYRDLDKQQDEGQIEAKIRQTKEVAEVLLPVSDNQYDLSVQIEALIRGLGIGFTALTFSDPLIVPKTITAENAGPKKLIFSLSVGGSFEEIQKVIQGLVSLNRYLEIDQVTIDSSDSSKPMSAQITGFAYHMPVGGNKPTLPTPSPSASPSPGSAQSNDQP